MSQEEIIRVREDGRFDRKMSEFRDTVTADGSSGFPAEKDRYHLYVAWACPWAHRTLLMRKLLGLEDAISVSVVHWLMQEDGSWVFDETKGYPDDLHGYDSLEDVYRKAEPRWDSIGTVPVLWDKKQQTVVNNESQEIVRMLDTAFKELQTNDVNFLPPDRVDAVDAMIAANYEAVNNGVYKAGFARKQDAHEEAVTALFDRLDELELHLSKNRYLLGDRLTEADWCLFPTLLRFDPVYVGHFKCNIRRIVDYPNLWNYTKELYQYPGVKDTINLEDTKRHYYGSHTSINPHRIVPVGPALDLDGPHDRDRPFDNDATR